MASTAARVFVVLLLGAFGSNGQTRLRGRIVFATASIPQNDGDIYVINADGSHRRRLTNSRVAESNPIWSPNGKSIAFVGLEGTHTALHKMTATGARQHVLFRESPSSHGAIDDPSWSPNGQLIAFGSARDGTYQIWTYALNGTFNEITHEGRFNDSPSWSPSGKQLAYTSSISSRHSSIFVINADGSHSHDVSHTPVLGEGAVWSPNGKWIALRSLNADWEQHEADSPVIVNPAGTGSKRLVTGGAIFPTAWSPNGDAILFLWVSDPGNVLTSHRQLYTVSLHGGIPHPVPGTGGAIGGASWHK